MRKLYFLLPGTTGRFACGGLWAELKTFQLAQQICSAEVVTYRQREVDKPFLADVLKQSDLKNAIFMVSWGFDVPKLVSQLKSLQVVYHAHSAEYGFKLPSAMPIITVSRHTLGYWGQKSPHALLYYLPNQISDEFYDRHLDRDIDVLVQARKSSDYLLKELIPALRSRCRVTVIDSFVEDLPGLFNRSRLYLYDSAQYWAEQGVTEGFGLQPMEALACGCQVFSSVNGGLADYLDPGFNCHKIAGYAQAYDVERILHVLQDCNNAPLPESFFAEHRTEKILSRLTVILNEINHFFDFTQKPCEPIEPLTSTRLMGLKLKRNWNKLKKRFG
ncbi:glycosyltransferase [Egbenema bharatensis]|uniref:glycosyltransferase n=1 Tax=Egbenema bharatensis TaxID=3463334 RepID=UPI003A847B73